MNLDIPERKGIYLFLLPKWKCGYIGSSVNLKRRYLEHTQSIKNGNKHICTYIKKYEDIEYMILEYLDDYSQKDIKIIEESWIEYYKRKGLNLLNVSKPTEEVLYGESISLIIYKAKTLEFIGEFSSLKEAARSLNVSKTSISRSLHEKSSKGCTCYTTKGCFIFFKDTFSREMLVSKNERYLNALKRKAKLAGDRITNLNKTMKSIKINQYSKTGDLIKIWDSSMEAARNLNIRQGNISNCLKEKIKTCGGYVWRYAES